MGEKQTPDEQKQLVVDILGPNGRVRCTKCLLKASTYSAYGNIAIQAFATTESRTANGERLEPGEDWGVLTVNPAEELGDRVVCVKDYSEGEGNLRTLLDAGIVETPYRYIPSGFVTLPVCRLTPKGRDWVKSELANPPAADRTFHVTWTAHYKCSATVKAADEAAAMEACYGLDDDQVKREFEGTSDWSAEPDDGDGETEETEAPPVLRLTAGPGPYNVALVSSNGIGDALYRSPEPVATEEEAVELVLREAERLKLHIDHGAVRHWVTGLSEHMVDFGDWAVYGVITSSAKPEDGDGK